MKKILLVFWVSMMIVSSCFSQASTILSQSFENLSIYSPSFTGANDFLDVKTGFRKQWVGLSGSPDNIFLHVQSPINVSADDFVKNARKSGKKNGGGKSRDKQVTKLKLGAGGYLIQNSRGPIRQLETGLNAAVHVPIDNGTYLSLGISNGITGTSIDLDQLILENPGADQTLNSLRSNGTSVSYYQISSSIGVHSDKYYFSYSSFRLTRAQLGGNGDLEGDKAPVRHDLIGGYRFKTVNKIEMIAGAYIQAESGTPAFYEMSFRARYDKQYWAGLAYRNDQTIIGVLGWQINKIVKFGYSFDYKSSEAKNLANASHEILLGFSIFNKKNSTPFW